MCVRSCLCVLVCVCVFVCVAEGESDAGVLEQRDTVASAPRGAERRAWLRRGPSHRRHIPLHQRKTYAQQHTHTHTHTLTERETAEREKREKNLRKHRFLSLSLFFSLLSPQPQTRTALFYTQRTPPQCNALQTLTKRIAKEKAASVFRSSVSALPSCARLVRLPALCRLV